MHRIALLLLVATAIFAEASGPGTVPAVAPAAGDAAPAAAQQGNPLFTLLPLGLFAVIFYFLIMRPQQKEEKRRKELVASIKRGDKVVTIGGAHGVVETVGETTVEVRLGGDNGVVVTYNKAAVQQNLSAEQATPKK